jgi:hypothetical protein
VAEVARGGPERGRRDMTITADDVQGIQPGRAKASRTEAAFCSLTNRNGAYVVECGWVVPEADEDDHGSCTYQPFRSPRARPWVGREVSTTDAAEAACLYETYKSAVFAGGASVRDLPGTVTGSVHR